MDSLFSKVHGQSGQHHLSTFMTQLLPVGEGVQNLDVDGSVFQGHTSIRILGHDETRWQLLAWEATAGWEQSGLVVGLPGVRRQLCPDEGLFIFASRG